MILSRPNFSSVCGIYVVYVVVWLFSEAMRFKRYVCDRFSGAWLCVSFEYCVLSGKGLCVGLITRPEESCRIWRV